jgi:hypothetical protein
MKNMINKGIKMNCHQDNRDQICKNKKSRDENGFSHKNAGIIMENVKN